MISTLLKQVAKVQNKFHYLQNKYRQQNQSVTCTVRHPELISGIEDYPHVPIL
jgi:hypothetical protein